MSWQCPNCKRFLKNANQWHCCINQDIDNLFFNKKDSLVRVFDRILPFIVDLKEVDISATKNCIVFFKTQTFLVIKPMKNVLNIKFYLSEPMDIYPIIDVKQYGRQFEHHIRLAEVDEVDAVVFDFIRKSHDLFNSNK